MKAYGHRSPYLSIWKTICRFSLRDGMLSLSSSSSSASGSSPDSHYIPGLKEHGTGPDFSFMPSTAYSQSTFVPHRTHATPKATSSPTGASSPLSTLYSPPQKLEDLATSVYLPTTTTVLHQGTPAVGTKSTSNFTDSLRNIPKSTL